MIQIIEPGKRTGIIHIPASKSDTQRHLLAAALAKGTSVLSNVGESSDEKAMLAAIQQLGAEITSIEPKKIAIKGVQTFPTEATISVHESGLGCRLLTNVCATLPGKYTIAGSGSLTKRPMPFFQQVLTQLGAKVSSQNGYIPLTVEGPMIGGEISFEGKDSSQYLSGLLMACPIMQDGTTEIHVSNLNSLPYVQMTINTLIRFGIIIQHKNYEHFIIGSRQRYISCDYTIESDWSSASYWLVASALGLPIELTGLNLASLQADKQIIKAFEAANCKVIFNENRMRIDGRKRQAFSFDATNCPDLFPALVTFASLCEGKSMIKGVSRLKHKESNRGIVLQEEFAKIGIEIVIVDDVMFISGNKTIDGARVNAHNDHRIAMCLGIAGIFANKEMYIEGAEAVNKSYPKFWEHLENLERS